MNVSAQTRNVPKCWSMLCQNHSSTTRLFARPGQEAARYRWILITTTYCADYASFLENILLLKHNNITKSHFDTMTFAFSWTIAVYFIVLFILASKSCQARTKSCQISLDSDYNYMLR